jgi:hypothetical protein
VAWVYSVNHVVLAIGMAVFLLSVICKEYCYYIVACRVVHVTNKTGSNSDDWIY